MNDELSPDELDELSSAMESDDPPVEETPEEISEDTPENSTEEESPSQEEASENPLEKSPAEGQQISHAQFMQLDENESAEELPMKPIQRMYDVKVDIEVVLGSCKMPLEEILRLQSGSVVELNKLAGEPVELIVNKKMIAKAEVVVIDDNFGIKITEILGSKHKLASL